MKSFGGHLLVLAGFLLFAGCATTSNNRQLSAGKPGKVVVRNVQGKAEYQLPGSNWTTAKVGTTLAEGASLRTGPGSTVDFEVANAAAARLVSDSLMHIRKLEVRKGGTTPDLNILLELPQGRVQGTTLRMAPESEFTIQTPAGTYQIK